jgi:LmbE family N-acetylglucosaminyl deacetylase
MTGRSVLAIGAHPDDIELGCGGTLARHVSAGDRVAMLVVTRGEEGPGDARQRVAEQQRAAEVLGVHALLWGSGIPDCRVSLHELELVHLIEEAIQRIDATIVYTHSPGDSHQDHRVVAQCTMGAARWVSTVLGYEAPSSLGFSPTTFVDISDSLDKKIEATMCHATQAEGSRMVSVARIRSAAAYHGYSSRRAHAEGFEPVRAIIEV